MELFFLSSDSDGKSSGLFFLISDNNDIRILHGLEELNLLIHVLIGIISLDTNAGCFEFILKLFGEVVVLGLNGNKCNLVRRDPEGECSLEVLDNDSDESLE